MRVLLLIASASASMVSVAEPPPGTTLNFVACPLVRDTNHPCWLAEYEGELYYLGAQGSAASAFYPPQLNHKALIEGTVADKPRICGGIVLEPVVVSTMRELDRSCNTILPAEGYADPPTNERGPQPAEQRQTRRNESVAKEPLSPPYQQRRFVIQFDFDMERPWIGETRKLLDASAYATTIEASKVEIIGYRGHSQLTNGTKLEEVANVAERRAQHLAQAIRELGVDAARVHVRWQIAPVDSDPKLRRAEIVVIP